MQEVTKMAIIVTVIVMLFLSVLIAWHNSYFYVGTKSISGNNVTTLTGLQTYIYKNGTIVETSSYSFAVSNGTFTLYVIVYNSDNLSVPNATVTLSGYSMENTTVTGIIPYLERGTNKTYGSKFVIFYYNQPNVYTYTIFIQAYYNSNFQNTVTGNFIVSDP